MKKWSLLIAFAALWISVRVPFEKTDVAKLVPVSALTLVRKDGELYVTSDRGDAGTGETLEEALDDMEMTCSGKIFLDTVEFLLVSPGSVNWVELSDYFRPGTYIVACGPGTDPEKAGNYLRNRKGVATLRDLEMNNKKMPVLQEVDGRYYLNGETGEFVSAMGVDNGSDAVANGDSCAERRLADEFGDWNPFGSGIVDCQ